MTIITEEFLDKLTMLKAGLSSREFLEQSSCFAFQDGCAMTFNDEIACRIPIKLDLEGAVQAQGLLEILGKVKDAELMIRQDEGELRFKGKRKGFSITMEEKITLPIDKVELPEKWRTLPPEFIEAIGLVHHCCSTNDATFLLTCVHIHPEWVEASDNFQAMRCNVNIGLGKSLLVRGKSIAHICSLGMDKIGLTKNWIHFKNHAGLIMSVRRYDEEFDDLTLIFKFKGYPITIPKGIADVTKRASVFSDTSNGEALVTVSVSENRVVVKGQSALGRYSEAQTVVYAGPPISFVIAPDLLEGISQKYSEARINEDRMKVTGGEWQYVTVLGAPEENKELSAEE